MLLNLCCDVHHWKVVGLHCHVGKLWCFVCVFWLFVYSADLETNSPFCVGLVEMGLSYLLPVVFLISTRICTNKKMSSLSTV